MSRAGNRHKRKDEAERPALPRADTLPYGHDVCGILNHIFNAAPDMLILIDESGMVLFAGGGITSSLGYQQDELIGRSFVSVLQMRDGRELFPPSSAENRSDAAMARVLDKRGVERTLEFTITPLKAPLPVRGIMVLARDVTERETAWKTVLESGERYRSLVEISGTPIIIVEEDMTISLANAAFEEISGYSRHEIEGQLSWRAFIAEHEQPRLDKYHVLSRIDPAAAPRAYESQLVDRSGALHDISITASVLPDMKKSVLSLLDITRRKQLENELLKAHKLESLAIIASGVAHDFNNALTIILSSVSLARQYAGADSKASKKLCETEKEIMRAKALTAQLLTFSRGGDPIRKACPIRNVVLDTVRFALRGSNVRVEFSVPDQLWLCDADSAQISQVLVNIVQNAKQAMPDGGVIFVGAKNIELQQRQHHTLSGGTYVLISIRDTGTGVPPDCLPRISDPFSSTKKNAIGIGLSTTYSIIKNHHGHIDVASEPGVGSIVYLYLPASEEQTSPKNARMKKDNRSVKVLLMDEDKTELTKAVALLSAFDYAVTPSSGAMETIDHFYDAHSAGAPFDAVILDLSIIGRSGGCECLRVLQEIDGAVKVIAVSRYARFFDLSEYSRFGFFRIAQKPYDIERLHELLQQALLP